MTEIEKIEEYFNQNLTSLDDLETISKLIKKNKAEQEELNKQVNHKTLNFN